MSFITGRKQGALWEDANRLLQIIKSHSFNITGKNERFFENALSNVLMSKQNEFKNKIISQIDRDVTVDSVYCFGKKHRPDIKLC